jgi:putative methionine-R-sulfoxide reductase with GAF domain
VAEISDTRAWFSATWVGALLNAAAVVSAAGAYLLSAEAGRTTGADRTRLLVLGAVLAAAVVAAGVLKQLRDARRIRTAEQVAIDAQEELVTTLNGALAPITNYLGELASAVGPAARDTKAGELRQAVVDATVRLTHPESRSAFYLMEPGGNRLVRQVYAGRATLPRAEFVAGTADGDSVLDLVLRGDLVFIEDVDVDPMVIPTTAGSYRTVIAVAVTAGLAKLGMLTVDAPDVGDLTAADVELVRVLANLLGSGLVQAG